jgi:hypothetical protein
MHPNGGRKTLCCAPVAGPKDEEPLMSADEPRVEQPARVEPTPMIPYSATADSPRPFLLPLLGAVAITAAGVASAGDDQTPKNHPATDTTVATIDIVKPIYYPHSPTYRALDEESAGKVDRLINDFVHLHSAMRYQEAKHVSERLLRLLPDSPAMHYNHACVLGRLHRTDEAIDALEQAIALGWRNLSQMRIDPDLQSIRWHDRYRDLDERLASTIRLEKPSPGPLRDDPWETIVHELPSLAAELAKSHGLRGMSIALIHDGKHVWTGEVGFTTDDAHAGDQPPSATDAGATPRRFRVEAPAHLLGVLGVLDEDHQDEEPGVIRLVRLFRHAAQVDHAAAPLAAPASHQQTAGGGGQPRRTDGDRGQRAIRSTPAARPAVVNGRVLRIERLPDDVHDLMRLAVEHLGGQSFNRYCTVHALPHIGMENSSVIVVGEHRTIHRAVHHAGQPQSARPARDFAGPPRPALETTADDLASLVAHILNMSRTPNGRSLDWTQISDHLLRSCATRELSLGSGMTIRRTQYGLRTDLVSVGGGMGAAMRWYPQHGSGIVILFESDDETAGDQRDDGRRAALRIAHHALGGEP